MTPFSYDTIAVAQAGLRHSPFRGVQYFVVVAPAECVSRILVRQGSDFVENRFPTQKLFISQTIGLRHWFANPKGSVLPSGRGLRVAVGPKNLGISRPAVKSLP